MEKHEHRKAVLNRMSRVIGHMNAVKTAFFRSLQSKKILGNSPIIVKSHIDNGVKIRYTIVKR